MAALCSLIPQRRIAFPDHNRYLSAADPPPDVLFGFHFMHQPRALIHKSNVRSIRGHNGCKRTVLVAAPRHSAGRHKARHSPLAVLLDQC